MADYSTYRPVEGLNDYPLKIDNFITAVESDVSALENAGYAEKPASFTEGNIPKLDASGNLLDSNLVSADVTQKNGTLVNGNYVSVNSDLKLIDSGVPVATGQTEYNSGSMIISLGQHYSASHYLNAIPRTVSVRLVCEITEFDWLPGEYINVFYPDMYVSFSTTLFHFYMPATSMQIPGKNNTALKYITNDKWRMNVIGVK